MFLSVCLWDSTFHPCKIPTDLFGMEKTSCSWWALFFGRALTRKGDGRTRQTYKRIKRGNVQKHYVEARETRFAPPVWDTGVTDWWPAQAAKYGEMPYCYASMDRQGPFVSVGSLAMKSSLFTRCLMALGYVGHWCSKLRQKGSVNLFAL